jgi:hypothetical protein
VSPLGPADHLTARPPIRLIRLVFESHAGRAYCRFRREARARERHRRCAVESLKALDPEWPIREADKAPNQFGAYMSRRSGLLMARCSSNGANVCCCEEYAVALTTWPRVRLRVPSRPREALRRPHRHAATRVEGGDDFHAVVHGERTPPSPTGWNACTITSAPASFATPRAPR